MYKRLAIVLYLGLLAAVVGSTGQLFSASLADSPKKAEKPAWQKGYKWDVYLKFATGEEFKSYRKFVGEAKYKGGQYYLLKLSHGWKIYLTKDLNEKAWIRKGQPDIVYEPERHLFDWPLEVGKEWKKPYTRTVGDKVRQRPGHFKVVAFEDVYTEGEAFKAFKIIEYGRKGSIRSEEWYAPEVMWKVKRITRGKKGTSNVDVISYDVDK